MRRSMKGNLLLLLSVMLLLTGCMKRDQSFPSIIIESPNEGDEFSYGDVTTVSLTASDNTGIERIEVVIKDEDNTIVFSESREYNNVRTVQGSFELYINDYHLPSGEYTLQAMADDGSNQYSDFISIYLNGVPRERKYVHILNHENAITSSIATFDSNLLFIDNDIISGQLIDLLPNHYDQVLYAYGLTLDGLFTLDGYGLNVLQNIQLPFGLGNNLFTDSQRDPSGRSAWISCADQQMREINRFGSISSSFTAPNVKQFAVTENYIIAYSETNLGVKNIYVYLKNTGALIQSLSITDPVLEVIALNDENRILLVTGDNVASDLVVYDVTNNFIDVWTPFNMAINSPFLCAERGEDFIAMAYTDQTVIYSFTGAVLSIGSAYNAIDIAIDDVNNQLFILEENGLTITGTDAELQIVNTVATTNAVAVSVMYNK